MKTWLDSNEVKTVPMEPSGCFLIPAGRIGRESTDWWAAGDAADGYWNFWELHYDNFYRHCLRWLNGNHADTEDALSTAKIKVWESLRHRANEISDLKAWIMRVIFNLCMDLRRQRTRYERLFVNAEETVKGAVDNSGVGLSWTDEMLFRWETNTSIRGAIVELPSSLKVPFILHACHDLSYGEVAEQLGLTPDNVRQRIHRARAVIKQRLSGGR